MSGYHHLTSSLQWTGTGGLPRQLRTERMGRPQRALAPWDELTCRADAGEPKGGAPVGSGPIGAMSAGCLGGGGLREERTFVLHRLPGPLG